MKLLAAQRRNTTELKSGNATQKTHEDGKNNFDVHVLNLKREKAKRVRLKTSYSKLKMYLKEKRKSLKEMERKDRLILKMRNDFEEREKEFAAALSALQRSLDLEREKYSKVEKMNSILEMELKNMRG